MNRIAIICLTVAWCIFSPYPAHAADDITRHVKSALVMDIDSGQILYESNAHQQVIPASLVKLMTALIAIEKSQQGQLSLDDIYTVSAAASRIGGHQVYLKQGERFTIRELLKAVTIGSANDAAYAVAEYAAGTHENFVKLMNLRAKQIGMQQTTFRNAHGLPPSRRQKEKDNISTAYDLGLLAKHVTLYPLIMQWSSTRLDSFRNGTFQLLNTNHRFLTGFDGATGLKTGYHSRGAGFNLVGTAQRNGRRLLAVILGADSSRERLKVAKSLLEKAFQEDQAARYTLP